MFQPFIFALPILFMSSAHAVPAEGIPNPTSASTLPPEMKACAEGQGDKNVCALLNALDAEMVLDALVESKQFYTVEAYHAFKLETHNACSAKAGIQDGSAPIPTELSICVEQAYREKYVALDDLSKITPPPQPPHKWD